MCDFKVLFSVFVIGAFALSGCNHSASNGGVDGPSIYSAWNARYHYDAENRKMIPYYKDKQSGRAWGRDEVGRMNFSEYYGADGKPKEDLLALHKRTLDRKRDERWDELNRLRMKEITDRLNGILLEEENEKKEEQTKPTDESEFMPVPFIPSGLDLEENLEEQEEFSPFSPIPAGQTDTDTTEPSPFMPLLP